MRHDFAGAAREIREQVKFLRREVDGAVLYKNAAGSGIDLEVADFYRASSDASVRVRRRLARTRARSSLMSNGLVT